MEASAGAESLLLFNDRSNEMYVKHTEPRTLHPRTIEALLSELKPHQHVGLSWMLRREAQPVHSCAGGIVADEAGVGKTLMTLTAVLEAQQQQQRATLLVTPSHLIYNWDLEIRKHFRPGTFRVLLYHGGDRKRKYNLDTYLYDYDVIITSYALVAQEYDQVSGSFLIDSILGERFERVVLDEGHKIKNPSAITSRAVCHLNSRYRWCLTATPLVNAMQDLYPLLVFLGVQPLNQYDVWRDLIIRRLQTSVQHGMNTLLWYLTPLMMRRTKYQVLELPQVHVHRHNIALSDQELEFIQLLFSYSRQRAQKIVDRVNELKRSQSLIPRHERERGDHRLTQCQNNVWTLITRLRQANNSPALVIAQMDRLQEAVADTTDDEEERSYQHRLQTAIQRLQLLTDPEAELEECVVCYDADATVVAAPCMHMCCEGCWRRIAEKVTVLRCPYCRTEVTGLSEPAQMQNVLLEEQQQQQSITLAYREQDESAKIKFLIHTLQRDEFRREKVVIVSQWVTMLDIIEQALHRHLPEERGRGRTCRLQGSVPVPRRATVVHEFETQPFEQLNTCLLSLTASSEGITLVSARHIFLVDMWWNFARFYQVENRLHRIGQQREVHIHHLCVPDTIEDNIDRMRQQKKNFSDWLMGRCEPSDLQQSTFMEKVPLLFNFDS